jgi:hypothetical protein
VAQEVLLAQQVLSQVAAVAAEHQHQALVVLAA